MEFVQNLTIKLFIEFVSTENMNLYSLYNVLKYKIYTVFTAKTGSHKNVTNFL